MSNFNVGDVFIINKKFADVIEQYYWPEAGFELVGTKVTLRKPAIPEFDEDDCGPSWYIEEDHKWFIPESCLSPLKVVEEYV